MVSGGASKHFRAKRGAIPKIEGGKGGHVRKCTGLGGHPRFLRENWGVTQYFSEII